MKNPHRNVFCKGWCEPAGITRPRFHAAPPLVIPVLLDCYKIKDPDVQRTSRSDSEPAGITRTRFHTARAPRDPYERDCFK